MIVYKETHFQRYVEPNSDCNSCSILSVLYHFLTYTQQDYYEPQYGTLLHSYCTGAYSYLGVPIQVLQLSSCVGTTWWQQRYFKEQCGYTNSNLAVYR